MDPQGQRRGWGGPSGKGVVWMCTSWWGGLTRMQLTSPEGQVPLGSPLGAFWASPPPAPPRPPAGSRGLLGQPRRRGGRLRPVDQSSLSYFEQLSPICLSADLKTKLPPRLWAWGPAGAGRPERRRLNPVQVGGRGQYPQVLPMGPLLPAITQGPVGPLCPEELALRPRPASALLPARGHQQVLGTGWFPPSSIQRVVLSFVLAQDLSCGVRLCGPGRQRQDSLGQGVWL